MSPKKAYRIVRTAIEQGKLVRPQHCSRCDAADTVSISGRHTIQAHHHSGYESPLDVEWLCARCHRAETPLPAKIGGKALGERNGQSKLTARQAIEIKRSEMGCNRLARLHGVDRKTIKRIRNGTQWREVVAASPALETGGEK